VSLHIYVPKIYVPKHLPLPNRGVCVCVCVCVCVICVCVCVCVCVLGDFSPPAQAYAQALLTGCMWRPTVLVPQTPCPLRAPGPSGSIVGNELSRA